MSESETPIACTLDATSYRDRIDAIRTLFSRALKKSTRDGPRLHLFFDRTARDDVEELVRKEKACCEFLDFKLVDETGALKLTITVPARAADGADDLLSPFTLSTAASSCGCPPKPTSNLPGLVTKLSLGGAGATLLCGAGCALAIGLASAGAGSAWLSAIDGLQAWWLPIVGIALALLALAWALRYRLGGTPRELRVLQIATLVFLVGALWGWIESRSA